MYMVSLIVEDMSKNIEGEVVSNVTVITDLKSVTPENLIVYCREWEDVLEKEFMRKGAR